MHTKEELDAIPDFDTYKKQLDELRTTDFSKFSQDEISHFVYGQVGILPQLVGWHNAERFNKFDFYRVRLNIDPNKEDLSLISTYSYPPAIFCKENGRANVAGKSVFYCSNMPFAAIFESKAKVGDIGYLSIWSTRAQDRVKYSVSLPPLLPDENIWQELASGMHEFAEGFLSNNFSDKEKQIRYLYKFVTDQFTVENNPYTLTSWLANEILFGDVCRDFIIYPSIAGYSKFCNFAFHPNSVDNNLKFKKVIKFKVEEIDSPNHLVYGSGKVGEIVNTRIVWRKAKLKEEIDFRDLKY